MSNTYTYRDGRFWKDGSPFFVIASDYQFYRDRRANWEDRLAKLRRAGVNTITFYIPWRHHLCLEGGKPTFDFTGRTKDSRDVVGFLQRVEAAGLLMIAKPGPFVHSELNVGGLPDLVCPSLNPEVPPARRHHGGPVTWCYDATDLPAPFDQRFDALVHQWLAAVHELLAPYVRPGSPLIALQLNDETVYCSSNDPPWQIGYEPSGMRRFHQLLAERYGGIEIYNRLHGTRFEAFEFVPGPRLPSPAGGHRDAPAPARPEDLLQYVDWAEYQWCYRRDVYARYQRYLDIDLPYLTNYAGITPPIEENVPDLEQSAQEPIPPDFAGLYPDWWFAMNRIESDAGVYHYGMISWLGVAAYDRRVFDRYINTARRARGINMEENWGFGMLYDAKSRYPLVPFYQTLVSLAGGATGYDIYCGVSTDYWDDSLDRITKKQCPTFPSHAPIDEQGRCRPMYDTAKMLNSWWAENGEALLRCSIDADVGYLLYPPYAAVSSWVPDQRYWGLAGHDIPRCGYQGFEDFSRSLQQSGYSFAMFELEPATVERLASCRALAIHSAFFMDEPAQHKLVEQIERGGRLFISGELPTVDLQWRPCTLLGDAVRAAASAGHGRVVHRRENLFAGGRFAQVLAHAGLVPSVCHADNMRAYLHHGEEDDFVFFFSFDTEGEHDKWVEFSGQRVELRLGSKTSGVLRLRRGRIVSCLVKGENEVEGIRARIRIRFNDQVIEGQGDFTA